MEHNRNTPASLQILCRLITARGTATDDELTTQAAQIADLWLGELEVVE